MSPGCRSPPTNDVHEACRRAKGPYEENLIAHLTKDIGNGLYAIILTILVAPREMGQILAHTLQRHRLAVGLLKEPGVEFAGCQELFLATALQDHEGIKRNELQSLAQTVRRSQQPLGDTALVQRFVTNKTVFRLVTLSTTLNDSSVSVVIAV